MRKRLLIIIAVALLIATAGVVYAHWIDTLNANINVSTGSVNVNWKFLATNDDGVNNDGWNTNEPGSPTVVFNADGTTSDDPSAFGANPSRYGKDIADCVTSPAAGATDQDYFTLTVRNAYPSYHCSMWAKFANQGTVPLKLYNINWEVRDGNGALLAECAGTPTGPCVAANGTGVNVYGVDGALDMQLGVTGPAGWGCGYQLDPESLVGQMTLQHDLHVDENAVQGVTYSFSEILTFWNWNEVPTSIPVCTTFSDQPA